MTFSFSVDGVSLSDHVDILGAVLLMSAITSSL
jgi:hypothetical protein